MRDHEFIQIVFKPPSHPSIGIDKLIKTGKITPFSNVQGVEKRSLSTNYNNNYNNHPSSTSTSAHAPYVSSSSSASTSKPDPFHQPHPPPTVITTTADANASLGEFLFGDDREDDRPANARRPSSLSAQEKKKKDVDDEEKEEEDGHINIADNDNEYRPARKTMAGDTTDRSDLEDRMDDNIDAESFDLESNVLEAGEEAEEEEETIESYMDDGDEYQYLKRIKEWLLTVKKKNKVMYTTQIILSK